MANAIVQRTLDICFYCQPKFVIIENPQTGLLKDQPMMQDISYDDVDYCKYGMPYRKRTRLWNNILAWVPKPLLQGLRAHGGQPARGDCSTRAMQGSAENRKANPQAIRIVHGTS